MGPWGWDVGDGGDDEDEDGGVGDENDGGGGLTLEGAEGAVVRFRDGMEGGWEVLWDGDGEGEGEGDEGDMGGGRNGISSGTGFRR